MSSKLSFISAPAQMRSDTVATLNQMSKARADREAAAAREANTERRFQINAARQGRLDQLAQARMNLQEKRYTQDRSDKMAAMSAEPAFIGTDSIEQITETIDDPDTAYKGYDVKAATQAVDSAPKIFDYKAKEVDPAKQKLLDSITAAEKIESATEKEAELNRIYKEYDPEGYKLQSRWGDVGMGMGEVMGDVLYKGLAPLGKTIASPFLTPETEIAMQGEIDKRTKEYSEGLLTPREKIDRDLAGIRENIKANEEGIVKRDASYDAQAKFFDKFKTVDKYAGQKDVTTPKLVSKTDYNKGVKAESTELIKQIRASGDTDMVKANRIKAVNAEVKRKLVEYASDKKLITDAAKEKAKSDRKLTDKLIAQEQSQSAKKSLKILEIAHKQATPEEKQKIKLEMELLRAKIVTEKKK